MYVGRFVVVGPAVGAYRVSSRSFPHRRIVDRDGSLTVVPTEDAPETDNPYIAYNCMRITGPGAADAAVLGNGSHVDPIVEKLDRGYPARDALADALLALDYEKDDYDTPRIAGVLTNGRSSEQRSTGVIDPEAYVGIVRRDALLVERIEEPTLVATYEKVTPEPIRFDATSADEAARDVYARDFEHPVCAAGVARSSDGFECAIENGGG